MNASGIGRPAERAASLNSTSRRTFLKGAGLVGAAGLASAAGLNPLLTTTSADASTRLVLGVEAPGPWETTKYQGYVPVGTNTWHDLLPNALGCRSYNDNPFTTAVANGQPDDAYTVLGNPPTFLGQTIKDDSGNHVPTKVVASIKPDPTALLNGDLDGVLYDFILDGAQKAADGHTYAGAPKLTVWHEAGNLYGSDSPYASYGLQPLTENGAPTNSAAAQRARSMHAHMQNLCDQVKSDHPELDGYHVTYGCIIYGQIDVMADNNDQDGPTNWVPKSSANGGATLDWYGIDVYYDSGPDWGRGDLNSYTTVDNYLSQWLAVAKNRSGGSSSTPMIHITECNANQDDADARPAFFENLASWLNNNIGGGNPHLLTFFPQGGGQHSVQWGPPQPSTVQALQQIQAGTFG